MRDKIKELIAEETINIKIKEIAQRINNDYNNKDLTLVVLFTGAYMFASDLSKQININTKIIGINVSSYKGTNRSELQYERKVIKEPNVIIIDDIIDSGNTLKAIKTDLIADGCEDVKICCFLDKKSKREVDIEADYIGFEIPDYFVVGYGMDIDNEFRNLPYIGYIPPTVLLEQITADAQKLNLY